MFEVEIDALASADAVVAGGMWAWQANGASNPSEAASGHNPRETR